MTAQAPGRAIAPPPPPPKANGGPPPSPILTQDVKSFFGKAPSRPKGYFVVVAGPPKYGKTTFAVGAPNPAFVMADRNGLDRFPDAVRKNSFEPESWPQVMAVLAALRDGEHDFKTVVLDTIFKAEAMLIRHLCAQAGKTSLWGVSGGYNMLASEVQAVADMFFSLNARGIHTIAISQVESKTVKDPSLDDYERQALATERKTALVWAAAADVNMYVQPEIKERDRIDGGKDKEDRVKVDFTGKAICHVRPAAGIEAGNRLFLDSPMTYSWAALELGAAAGAELRERLFAHLATLNTVDRAAADWRLNQAGWSREAAEDEITGKWQSKK